MMIIDIKMEGIENRGNGNILILFEAINNIGAELQMFREIQGSTTQ